MNVETHTLRLSANAAVVASVFEGVALEQARWKPDGGWSMLEVLNHLCDEERDDFRQRLDLTLHHPSQEWPPIDPEGWATQRAYNQRDLQPSLADFLAERRRSVEWLRSLHSPDLTIARRHPQGFELRAGDLLASWIAHDLGHVRQIVDIQRQYLAATALPYSIEYAG